MTLVIRLRCPLPLFCHSDCLFFPPLLCRSKNGLTGLRTKVPSISSRLIIPIQRSKFDQKHPAGVASRCVVICRPRVVVRCAGDQDRLPIGNNNGDRRLITCLMVMSVELSSQLIPFMYFYLSLSISVIYIYTRTHLYI